MDHTAICMLQRECPGPKLHMCIPQGLKQTKSDTGIEVRTAETVLIAIDARRDLRGTARIVFQGNHDSQMKKSLIGCPRMLPRVHGWP
jgi:hypothetical protein